MSLLRALRRGQQRFLEQRGSADYALHDSLYDEYKKRFLKLTDSQKGIIAAGQKLCAASDAFATALMELAQSFSDCYINVAENEKDQKAIALHSLAKSFSNEISPVFVESVRSIIIGDTATEMGDIKSVRQRISERENLRLDADRREKKLRSVEKDSNAGDEKRERFREKAKLTRESFADQNAAVISELRRREEDWFSTTNEMFGKVTCILESYSSSLLGTCKRAQESLSQASTDNPVSSRIEKELKDEEGKTETPEKTEPDPLSSSFVHMHAVNDVGDEFFYLNTTKEQVGPVSLAEFRRLYGTGVISDSTFIFGHEMKDWTELRNHQELMKYLN